MRIILITTLIGLCAVTAYAASDADTLATAGILNTTWAMDCSKPPGKDNYYLLYGSKPDGAGTETQRTTSDDTRTIRNAQIISDQWLIFTYLTRKKEEYSILTKREGNRKKSWWSIRAGNKPLIMNGKFVASGAEVPWFEKCK